MSPFWLIAALLTCASVALVVVPLLRRSTDADPKAERDQRLAVYRDRRRELERDRDAGRLAPDEAERAIDELALEAAAMLGSGDGDAVRRDAPASASPSASGRGTRLAISIVLSIAIPLAAFGVYRQVGQPELAADPELARGDTGEPQLDQAVAEIEKRLREQPDDGEAWAMLGEARRLQNRPADAIAAFRKALERLPEHPQVLASLAEAVVASKGGDFAGEPVALLERALKADPDSPKALALMGAAQFRLGRPREAVVYLERLQAGLPEGSPQREQIAAVVARMRSEAGGPAGATAPGGASAPGGMPVPPAASGASPAPGPLAGAAGVGAAAAPSASAPPPPAGAAASAGTIAGTVTLAAALRAKLPTDATLFVVARATEGPRIPVAVLRVPARNFPFAFTLSDAQAMDPSRTLSTVGTVVVEARISASGNAMRQPGDLIGTAPPVRTGERGLAIEIDRVVE